MYNCEGQAELIFDLKKDSHQREVVIYFVPIDSYAVSGRSQPMTMLLRKLSGDDLLDAIADLDGIGFEL